MFHRPCFCSPDAYTLSDDTQTTVKIHPGSQHVPVPYKFTFIIVELSVDDWDCRSAFLTWGNTVLVIKYRSHNIGDSLILFMFTLWLYECFAMCIVIWCYIWALFLLRFMSRSFHALQKAATLLSLVKKLTLGNAHHSTSYQLLGLPLWYHFICNLY